MSKVTIRNGTDLLPSTRSCNRQLSLELDSEKKFIFRTGYVYI